MSLAPESLFCSMLEAQYNAIISSIELLIGLPAYALQTLQSNLKRIFDLLYAVIAAAVDLLVAQLDEALGLTDIDENKTKLAFCALAYECQALRDLLFDPDNNLLPFLTDAQKLDIQTNFDEFEKYVCKIGLRDLLDSWTSLALDRISDELDALQAKLLGALGIDKLIADYMEYINGTGIFEAIDQLDAFAKCAFGTCNFAETGANGKDEYYTKLNVEPSGTSVVFTVNDKLLELYQTDNELGNQISQAKFRIDKWKNQGIRDIENGKGVDEVLYQ